MFRKNNERKFFSDVNLLTSHSFLSRIHAPHSSGMHFSKRHAADLLGLGIGVMSILLLCFHCEGDYPLFMESRTSGPTNGEFPMRTMFLAAAAVFALGMGAASAQGGAGFTAPIYGQKWAEIQRAEHLNATAHTTTPERHAHAAPFWHFWSKKGG